MKKDRVGECVHEGNSRANNPEWDGTIKAIVYLWNWTILAQESRFLALSESH